MTAGGRFLVGALLVVTAAKGGSLTSPAKPSPAATTSVQGPTVGQVFPAPAASLANPPTGPPTVVGPESRPEKCTDPLRGGSGLQVADPDRSALLIGDSQSGGAAGVPADRTWAQTALRDAGYDVRFVGQKSCSKTT
jgi:hypothetical protein